MSENRVRLWGFFFVTLVVLAGYLVTIAPTASFWDASERIGCAYSLGVPHPPGTPLLVLIGRMFSLIPFSKEIAYRVNLYSALSGAISSGLIYLIIVMVIGRWGEIRTLRERIALHVSGVSAGLICGFSFTFWFNAVEAEAYAPSALFLVAPVWLALVWRDRLGGQGSKRVLLLIVYILSLSIGIHLLPLLAAPGILLFVLVVKRKELLDPKLILGIVFFALLGLTTYFYLILRARLDPGINEVSPTDWQTLWDVFARKQYGPVPVFANWPFPRRVQLGTDFNFLEAIFHQLRTYIRYFLWQYTPFPRTFSSQPIRFLSVLGTSIISFLGLYGIWHHFKKDKKTFILLAAGLFFTGLLLVGYLNIQFCPTDSLAIKNGWPTEVRPRHYFFGPSFMMFTFFIGLGIYGFLRRNLSKVFSLGGLCFLLSFVPLVSNFKSDANRRGNWIPSDYGHNMLVSCDEGAVLFTNGDNDTFPLWFVQEVKKFKKYQEGKGVMVANLSLLNTSWYIKQLRNRGIPISFSDFVADNLLPYPMAKDGKHLTDRTLYVKDLAVRDIIATNAGYQFEPKLLLRLTAETLPKKYQRRIPRRYWMKVDRGRHLVDPRIYTRHVPQEYWVRIPEEYLLPPEDFAEKVLKDYKGEIPIYFATTVSRENLTGYESHLRLEGLVYRVVEEEGLGMIDLRKTEENLFGVYRYRGIVDDDWEPNETVVKDGNTLKLISNYAAGFFALGSAHENRGDLERAIRAFEVGKRFRIGERLPFNYHLSQLYLRLGDLEKAERELLESVEDRPDELYTHYLLGELYRRNGQKEKASETYRRAIELGPENPVGYAGLITLYSATKDSAKLIQLTAEVLSKPKLAGNLVALYSQRGETSQAQRLLEAWVTLHPEDKKAGELLERYRKR